MGNDFQNISNSLAKQQISRAIFYLNRWNNALQTGSQTERRQQIKDLSETYNTYLDTYVNNTEMSFPVDFDRQLAQKCYRMADGIKSDYLSQADNTYETQQLKHAARPADADELKNLFSQIQAYNHEIEVRLSPLRSKYEDNLNQLFLYFWLTDNISQESAAIYKQYVINEDDEYRQLGILARPLVISALTLNIIRHYSEDNILLIIDALESSDTTVRVRAYIGIILIVSHYYNRYQIFPRLKQIIDEELINQPHRLENIKIAVTDLIRTLETERLSRIMNNEIVPEILKRSSKNVQDGEIPIIDLEAMTGNPDWTDYKNSLEQKLVHLSELQAEGSDASFNTFQQQKHLPFFQTLSHWFLPFDTSWSNIANLFRAASMPIEKMLQSHYMCDSDCYSLCMAFSFFSAKNKSDINSMIAKYLPGNDESDDNEPDFKQDNTFIAQTHNYTHNLYRFFRLNNFGFDNLLEEISQYATTIIPLLFKDDTDRQLDLAHFYFNKEQYQPALDLYLQIIDHAPSAEIFQKMGYAEEHLEHTEQALKYYTIADTYSPDNIWTLKRMLACSPNTEQRSKIYDKILQLDPDNKQALIGTARQLTEQKLFDKALEIYYKLDFLYPDTLAIQRQLALCAIYSKKFTTALRYWDKINAVSDDFRDLLNTAHTYLIQKQTQEAIKYYIKSWNKAEKKNEFWVALRNDTQRLADFGIKEHDIHLLDEVLINNLYNS